MAKYRKKTLLGAPWQWRFDQTQKPEPSWLRDSLNRWPDIGGLVFEPTHASGPRIRIRTLEGIMTARPGDWIVPGALGEVYSIKEDVFSNAYDRVEDEREQGGEVMIHPSNRKCDNCHERHTPGNLEECVECLMRQIEDLEDQIDNLERYVANEMEEKNE